MHLKSFHRLFKQKRRHKKQPRPCPGCHTIDREIDLRHAEKRFPGYMPLKLQSPDNDTQRHGPVYLFTCNKWAQSSCDTYCKEAEKGGKVSSCYYYIRRWTGFKMANCIRLVCEVLSFCHKVSTMSDLN